MNGPNRPGNSNMNNRNNNKNHNDKKRPALSFRSIVLWAVLLVVLLNTCSSSLRNASMLEVSYMEFRQWVEEGWVDQVDMESSAYYFTVKEGSAPLVEYETQL